MVSRISARDAASRPSGGSDSNRVSTIVGQFFAWTILLLTIAVSYEVFSRYALGRPTDWAFDASYILYGILFIMAGAYALARNAHVRGDFLYRL